MCTAPSMSSESDTSGASDESDWYAEYGKVVLTTNYLF